MPRAPVITPNLGAEVERRGNTDWIETNRGPRKLRTFNGVRGTWNLTPLGRRY